MTRYITDLDVQAWQYEGGGVIPDGAREVFDRAGISVVHRTEPYERTTWAPLVPLPEGVAIPEEGTPQDYLWFYDHQTASTYRCPAGDWIVAHEYGVEAVPDSWFRDNYRQVGEGE